MFFSIKYHQIIDYFIYLDKIEPFTSQVTILWIIIIVLLNTFESYLQLHSLWMIAPQLTTEEKYLWMIRAGFTTQSLVNGNNSIHNRGEVIVNDSSRIHNSISCELAEVYSQ